MTSSRIPTGPIEIAPYNAITPPRAPRGAAATETFRAELLVALDGIQLGAYDHRMIAWLAGWDTETVATICSWLLRKSAAEREPFRVAALMYSANYGELRAKLRELAARWEQRARDNADFYNRCTDLNKGAAAGNKAEAYAAFAQEIHEVLAAGGDIGEAAALIEGSKPCPR